MTLSDRLQANADALSSLWQMTHGQRFTKPMLLALAEDLHDAAAEARRMERQPPRLRVVGGREAA